MREAAQELAENRTDAAQQSQQAAQQALERMQRTLEDTRKVRTETLRRLMTELAEANEPYVGAAFAEVVRRTERGQTFADAVAALPGHLRASAAALAGLKVGGEFSGGCADSGFAAAVGTPTICATGPVGGNAHRPDEYLELDSLVPRAQAMAIAILQAKALLD